MQPWGAVTNGQIDNSQRNIFAGLKPLGGLGQGDIPKVTTPLLAGSEKDVGNLPIAHDRVVPEMYMKQLGSSPNGEPRIRLPTFNGRGDWQSFWTQFSFIARQYRWSEEKQLAILISCLEDTAIQFVSRLPVYKSINLNLLAESLAERFGDQMLPETYRATLDNTKRRQKESLQEYAARVEDLMRKAYPGLETTPLYTSMTIDHIIKGIPDATLVYDIRTKKPTSVKETLDMIAWHECCRSDVPRANIRQISNERGVSENKSDGAKYITEKQLEQFKHDLHLSLLKEIRELLNKPKSVGQFECFFCHELGHMIRERPHRLALEKNKTVKPKGNEQSNLRTNGYSSKN